MPATHKVLHQGVSLPVTAGLVFWLDATQIRGAADGSSLATWPDESGNGRNFTQVTGADQPTYHNTTPAGLINTRAAVQFNGTSDFMSAAAIANAQPYSLFVVFKNASSTGNTELFSSNSSNVDFIGRAALNVMEMDAGSFIQFGTWDTAVHFAAGVYNGASSFGQQDGTRVTGNVGNVALSGAPNLGAPIPPVSAWFQGLVGEMALYSRALSVAEVNALRSYAQGKWGTP